jgi:hypothetical protein
MYFQGEVIQPADCRLSVFKQELDKKVVKDSVEEGFGNHDLAASAEVNQDGGESDVENGSHVLDVGEETESAEERK